MIINSIGYNCVHGVDYSVSRSGADGEYLLMLMKSSGIFIIDGIEHHAENDTAIIFESEFLREYSADGEPFVFDWVSFSSEGDGDFIDSLELPKNRPIDFCDGEFLSSMIKSAAVEFYSASSRRVKMIDAFLRSMLIRIGEAVSIDRRQFLQSPDPHYGSLSELREKIYRNPQQKWNVDTMAAEVNMSRSYFQHIYRETFGVSCISDVIGGKLEKAKELLSETSCTVSQVAAMCGYDNDEHFMRQFKKLVGVTPTAYRKKNV